MFMKKKCDKCKEYLDFHGQDIKCVEHRKPHNGLIGNYLVGCRKCDNVLHSDEKEDSFCMYCAR
jgi:hypothetical protein